MWIDAPQEALYYANSGILQYVLRQLLASKPAAGGSMTMFNSSGNRVY